MKVRLKDVLKTLWRRLWKTSCKYVLKASWRRLRKWKIITLNSYFPSALENAPTKSRWVPLNDNSKKKICICFRRRSLDYSQARIPSAVWNKFCSTLKHLSQFWRDMSFKYFLVQFVINKFFLFLLHFEIRFYLSLKYFFVHSCCRCFV